MNTLMMTSAGLTAETSVLSALDANLANQNSAGFLALMPTTGAWAVGGVSRVGGGPGQALGALPLSVAAVTSRNLAPSAFQTTGRPLDVALPTARFFAVRTPSGVAYTRAGAFHLSPSGGLVDAAGASVLSTGGTPIVVPAGASVSISTQGVVMANGQPVSTLQQVHLSGTITSLGGSYYTGTVTPVIGGSVVPGALNTSNTSLTNTLAALTRAQALYSADASAWHVADKIRQQGDQLATLP